MNKIKTLNEFLTRTIYLLAFMTFSAAGFAQTPNITASIEEVVISQTNGQDANGNYLLDYAAHLAIDIEMPPVGPGETISKLSDIIGISFDLDVEHFGDLHVDGEDLLFCYGATGHQSGIVGSGTIRVQTAFENGMQLPNGDCYTPDPTKAVVALIVDSSQKDDSYHTANFGDCINNNRDFTEMIRITNAYYILDVSRGSNTFTLNGNTINETFTLPCVYPEFSIADFSRSWMHVCTVDDGSLTIDWSNAPMYNDVYVSIDGGSTYESVANANSHSVYNLAADDYDVRVKLGAYGYGFILDDINIQDLSHDATRSWGHPTCGNSNGWLQINWVQKNPNLNMLISINGGQNYITVPSANEYYRVENLPEGDYDIRLKWSYAPFACPTQLDDINLRDQWIHCKTASDISSKSIRVYPNPANKQVNIQLKDALVKQGVLKVHDLVGKEVYTASIEANQQRLTLNIEHLDNGVYLISYKNDRGIENQIEKLTISH